MILIIVECRLCGGIFLFLYIYSIKFDHWILTIREFLSHVCTCTCTYVTGSEVYNCCKVQGY